MKQYIDRATGEIVEGLLTTKEQQIEKEQRTARQREYISSKLDVDKFDKVDAHFSFHSMRQYENIRDLSNKHLGYFLILVTYADTKNMLRVSGGKKPMKKVDMKKALHLSDNKALNNFLTVAIEKGLIIEGLVFSYGKERKAYYINPDYSFKKGQNSPYSAKSVKDTVKVYEEQLQNLFEQQQVKPADIGIIYKCIHFVHIDTNSLVLNPFESDLEFVEYFTGQGLCEELGLSQPALSLKFKNLRYPAEYKGQIIFCRVFKREVVGSTSVYKMNPLLVNRKATPPTKAEYDAFLVDHFKEVRKSAKTK